MNSLDVLLCLNDEELESRGAEYRLLSEELTALGFVAAAQGWGDDRIYRPEWLETALRCAVTVAVWDGSLTGRLGGMVRWALERIIGIIGQRDDTGTRAVVVHGPSPDQILLAFHAPHRGWPAESIAELLENIDQIMVQMNT